MFYVLAFTPALATLVLLAAWAAVAGKHYRVFGCAALGCLISAASPWYAMWHARYVLNDHTANIGAGLLAFGQPVLVPVAALLGAVFGWACETALRPRRSVR